MPSFLIDSILLFSLLLFPCRSLIAPISHKAETYCQKEVAYQVDAAAHDKTLTIAGQGALISADDSPGPLNLARCRVKSFSAKSDNPFGLEHLAFPDMI